MELVLLTSLAGLTLRFSRGGPVLQRSPSAASAGAGRIVTVHPKAYWHVQQRRSDPEREDDDQFHAP